MKKRDIISISIWILFIISIFLIRNFYVNSKKTDSASQIARSFFNFNSVVFNRSNDDTTKSIPLYPKSEAQKARANGYVGLKTSFDTIDYVIKVIVEGDTMDAPLAEVKRQPSANITFDFKCVEGWSQKTNWTGVPFRYFIQLLKSKKNIEYQNYKYVGLQTPDKKYYVGIDMASMLHKQTILAYEMNEEVLSNNQGYPIRLIIPIKYGIKHLKRIKYITFSNTPPADYWAEKGYDYDSGL